MISRDHSQETQIIRLACFRSKVKGSLRKAQLQGKLKPRDYRYSLMRDALDLRFL